MSSERIGKIIAACLRRPESTERYAGRVTMNESEGNDFNLKISRDIDVAKTEAEVNLAATQREAVCPVPDME